MSDPAPPKSVRLRQTGPTSVTDGSAPASPRQMARLRFLGVSFREPLTIGQAGTLIDRTNADPDFAAKIEEWHVRKFELHPTLYPAVSSAIVIPARQTEETKFQLPPRGETEPNATIFQKRRLELFSGCDFPVVDSLGRDQAGALITFLEAQSVARSLEALRADADARLRETGSAAPAPHAEALPQATSRPRRDGSVGKMLLGLVAALGLALLVYFGSIGKWISARWANGADRTGTVQGADPLRQAVAASQARAVKKYPALGVAGSRFNKAFVARYQQLSRQHDSTLTNPNWPEKLADECAVQLPAQSR